MPANRKHDVRGRTIGGSVTLNGRGLLSGKPVQMSLHPARHPAGIFFRVAGAVARIPARLSRLSSSDRTVRLAEGATAVSGVEHVLAAAGGLGICCLEIELSS